MQESISGPRLKSVASETVTFVTFIPESMCRSPYPEGSNASLLHPEAAGSRAGGSGPQPEAAGGRADPAAPGEDFCRIAIRIGVRLKVGSRILWEGTMCDRGCTDEKSLWAGPMCERGRSDL